MSSSRDVQARRETAAAVRFAVTHALKNPRLTHAEAAAAGASVVEESRLRAPAADGAHKRVSQRIRAALEGEGYSVAEMAAELEDVSEQLDFAKRQLAQAATASADSATP